MPLVTCPWPASKNRLPIHPVFLPFAGCRVRCIYCAQGLQTGSGPGELERTLARAELALRERVEQGHDPCEVAFFGGTFTAQEEGALALCLERARAWKDEGLVAALRCSTRPDATGSDLLERLVDAGFGCVELGIQSFDDRVLEASGRGHDGVEAVRAMQRAKASGLTLGVQLLPGLPFSTPEGFLEDVATSLSLGADFLRFYPCLVIETTALATLWRKGNYEPWDVPTTIEALARGLLMAHRHRVPVARVGVAREEGFEEHVLAGPRDPDIGTRVLSRALVLLLGESLHAVGDGDGDGDGDGCDGCDGRDGKGFAGPLTLRRVSLPRFVQGCLWGQGGENREILTKLGVQKETIFWEDTEEIRIWAD